MPTPNRTITSPAHYARQINVLLEQGRALMSALTVHEQYLQKQRTNPQAIADELADIASALRRLSDAVIQDQPQYKQIMSHFQQYLRMSIASDGRYQPQNIIPFAFTQAQRTLHTVTAQQALATPDVGATAAKLTSKYTAPRQGKIETICRWLNEKEIAAAPQHLYKTKADSDKNRGKDLHLKADTNLLAAMLKLLGVKYFQTHPSQHEFINLLIEQVSAYDTLDAVFHNAPPPTSIHAIAWNAITSRNQMKRIRPLPRGRARHTMPQKQT